MITFNPYPSHERINTLMPGNYHFIVNELYEARTANDDLAVKAVFYLPAIYYYLKYQFAINHMRLSHFILEQFLTSIGERYPETGVLDLAPLKGKTGLIKVGKERPTGNYLLVEEFIRPEEY